MASDSGHASDEARAKPLRHAPPRGRNRLLPEDYLERAMRAKSARARAKWAMKGLSVARALNPTTQAMLLRQLYLARYTEGRFDEAYDIAGQALGFQVLADVIHQDMARSRQAVGDIEGAAGHLRLAARVAPPSRRAFHWWTLGSLLFVAGRHDEAVGALARASRWGTTDKPLYQGHLALAKCRAGQKVRGIPGLIDRLASCPAGQGYGRFVLGQLAYQTERYDDARRYLQAFVARTRAGRAPLQIALAAELEMARDLLERMEAS